MKNELLYEGENLEEAIEKARLDLNADFDYSLVEEEGGGAFPENKVRIRVSRKTENSAVAIVRQMVEKMGFDADFSEEQEERRILINIECPENAMLIGRYGNTLEALQFLTNIIYNKNTWEIRKIVLDISGYRKKKKEELLYRVERLISEVRTTGRAAIIPQINSFDRRTIHLIVSENDDLTSYSQGEGKVKDLYIDLKHDPEE